VSLVRPIAEPLIDAARAVRTERPEARRPVEGPDFGELLARRLEATNATVRTADQQVQTMVETQGANLHETMIALEKADIAMRLTVRVGTLLVEAYREVSRMQV
jgi:flagellar hook-basal body complex protein FliE